MERIVARQIVRWGLRAAVTLSVSLFLGAASNLSAADSSGAESWLPPGAVVVLLAGLPGDVESERNYHDQMEAWLQVLDAAKARTEKIYLLRDDAEPFTAGSFLPVESLPARREDFLALGKSFAGRTNPVVVVAWGHGGFQGSTPVLHVRGPRLMPADFKAFAANFSQAQSRWFLFHRASGNFARELAGPQRSIIASENDTAFTSDPIGLPLLQKILRTNSVASFPAIAQRLGRATEAWYEERHLARTEEPTLWIDDQAPRQLAASESGSALASVPADKPAAVESSATKHAAAKDSPAELPANWRDIKRVEPQIHPDADAVVLRRTVKYTFASNPALAIDHEEFIQILTAEGKRQGDFDISFSPPDEELTFLDCEVLRPDGEISRLDPDQIREVAGESIGDYRAGKRKFFSLPGVGPGAIVHVRYKRSWKTYPLPYVSQSVPLADAEPVLDQTLQVNVPRAAAFHFAFAHAEARDPVLKQTDYGSSYTWRFENVPARTREALSPPSAHPALLLSTFPDWAAFAEWYGRITRLADEITPGIEAKAKELTRDAHTDREKAHALYNYVTGLRYVAVPLGVNSLRPHAAANVLQNQFGDCKDKANLFNALLRSLGIDAQLVLVPRFTQAHESIPGLAFNHAISRVRVGTETLWVDTTDDVCRFGMLPPGDPGRKVLVIDGKTTTLTQLPTPAASAHRLTLRATVDASGGTVDWPARLEVTTLGFPDYELRASAQRLRSEEVTHPLLAGKFRLTAGAFAFERQNFSSVSDLNTPFSWEAAGRCVGLRATVDGRQVVRAPFWVPKEWDVALNQRRVPLYLQQGYPLRLEQEIEITVPAGANDLKLPKARSSPVEPLRWKIDWTKKTGTIVVARFEMELVRGELSREESKVLPEQVATLLEALNDAATYAMP